MRCLIDRVDQCVSSVYVCSCVCVLGSRCVGNAHLLRCTLPRKFQFYHMLHTDLAADRSCNSYAGQQHPCCASNQIPLCKSHSTKTTKKLSMMILFSSLQLNFFD